MFIFGYAQIESIHVDYLPLFARLENRKCLLVGGGEVAERKAIALLNVKADVTCVSIEFKPALKRNIEDAGGVCMERPFEDSDVDKHFLVIAATDDEVVNQHIYSLCESQGKLVNVVDAPALCNVIFPAVVDRSPLIIAAATGGQAPVVSRLVRKYLDERFPANYGNLTAWAGTLRDMMREKVTDMDVRRRLWENIINGLPGEKLMSGKVDEANELVEKAINDIDSISHGEVYLVGAGPGDPDLLTFKALRLMQQSEVILYDRLVSPTIVEMCRRDAEYVYVGKARDKHTLPQPEINELLVHYAKQGKRVCRLKGGDPFIFGRGGEEIELLAEHNIPFQIVPGITAAAGCASYAGIPLTHRDYAQSVRFVTGHLREGAKDLDYQDLVTQRETLVFYMGLVRLSNVCTGLIAAGMCEDMPAALVERGTREDQRVIISTVEGIAGLVEDMAVKAPTLVIIGEVVSLHQKLEWR